MPIFDSFILYEFFLCLYEFHQDNVVTYYQRGVARKWHTWHMPPPPPIKISVSLWPAQPPFLFLPVPDQVRAHPKQIFRYATAYHTLFAEDSSWQQLYFESRLNLPNCWRSTMQPGYLAEDYWHQSSNNLLFEFARHEIGHCPLQPLHSRMGFQLLNKILAQ